MTAACHPLPCAQVQQRYAELEDCYGFFCQCERCKAEFEAPDEMSQLLNDILTKVGTEVRPARGTDDSAA
jgi:hypothetical protein